MTSFIAARGSGRSTSVIPAVPAASSVTTIAFIPHLPVIEFSPCASSPIQQPRRHDPEPRSPRHAACSLPHRGRGSRFVLPPPRVRERLVGGRDEFLTWAGSLRA